MLRTQSVLVMLFTLGGIALMIAAGGECVKISGIGGIYLMILAAIGALIANVGLSATMIVSAIRNQAHRS
jgi:hypothetical protein